MKTEIANYFKVIFQSQTYLNMFYLLLSFPLGIFYFVFLVTALSLGLGLAITLIGIPILIGTVLLWRVMGRFEAELTKTVLNIDISYKPLKQKKGFWKKIKAYLSDAYTWKSLVYLFLKFPLGIISFVFLATLISVSLSLIGTPIMYYLFEIGLIPGSFCTAGNICLLNSYFGAFIWGIIGLFLLFVSLHAFNGLANISGLLAKAMLERKK